MQLELHSIDVFIIIAYLALTIIIGFWVSRLASKNLDSYFLGGRVMPWYILGISNASGMFDITGTMWLVYICFIYGLKSIWLPWLWPTFNQIILMVYLSCWLRRSNVLTGAEWITTRFGKGHGANLAHFSVVIFALVSVTGFLAYEFKGMGKFASIFLPWDLTPNQYAIIILGVTTIYVVKGGMFSVVVTELLQFAIMTISSIAVGIIAMMKVSPEMLHKVIPEGWTNLFFGWTIDLDWSGILDSANSQILKDGYSLFTIFFMMMLIKGLLVSMAGPAPNYDMQRILATRNPKEAGMMSGFVSVVLIFPRYMLIAGLTVLALCFFLPELRAMGGDPDFELILPYAIKNFLPIGLMGLLIAGLLAAFMSTFAATVNAAPAYIVNDIYKRYINPHAEQKTYIRISYAASILVVLIGIGFGFIVESIDDVMQWIVNALWGGYAAANILKWYWWRFNGHGFFWGMITGIFAAMIAPGIMATYFPGVHEIYAFPGIMFVSLIGCIIGTLATKPEDENVLKKFYTTVRPWGFWTPIYEKVKQENPAFERNKNFGRDCFNILIGIVWQISLVALPVYIVIRKMDGIAWAIAIAIITTLILKKTWFDRLDEETA
ncbi:MAG: sodium:solute symporter [Candidatus Omnitrophota bacterium]|nr:MAG: sodium:solute symporter [Candidatus Omnitrophota bacterium]